MTIKNIKPIKVSGSRFCVRYQIQGVEDTAYSLAEKICVEETVEYPQELILQSDIRENIFGRIEDFRLSNTGQYESIISYADETSGFELPQLINVIFGNISMMPGIRVLDIMLSGKILKKFKGPRFGISGLRELLGIKDRPLLATAIKPMGLDAQEFSRMAMELALGGIDIIKDDHGLANQSFAPFNERVTRVSDAILNANEKTGRQTIYMPNVTGPFEVMMERINFAKKIGIKGLMLLPGYCSFDYIRSIAENDEIGLPIMAHPAFLGSYALSPDFGMHHSVLHGKLVRLAGADLSVFPNYIGRFSYSREDCIGINQGCKSPMEHIQPIFPSPGGGIQPDFFKELINVYGRDVALLISGNLHRQGDDLKKNVEIILDQLRKFSA